MTRQLANLLDIARTAVQLGTRVLETAAVRRVSAKGPKDVVTDLDLSPVSAGGRDTGTGDADQAAPLGGGRPRSPV